MKISELIGKMILSYEATFGIKPAKVIIGVGAKRVFEREVDEYCINNGKLIDTVHSYLGVPIEYDNKEKFIRLESKR
jgi:hypothetical protein